MCTVGHVCVPGWLLYGPFSPAKPTSVAVAGCNRIRRPRFDVNGTSASAESVVCGQPLAKDCWQSQFDRARTAVPSLSRK